VSKAQLGQSSQRNTVCTLSQAQNHKKYSQYHMYTSSD